MSGGAVYSLPTRELVPDFWQDAPVERTLVNQQYWLLTENSAVKLGYTGYNFDNPPYNKFSIMRATFDRWYAAKAEEAGVTLWTGCKADSLILKKGRITGVRVSGSREGDIYSGIIILAQGVNPILAEEAGLIRKGAAKNYSLYMKEMIALPEEVINQRLMLKERQGAVIGLLGDATAGLIGAGSLYTFKEHLGINAGVSVRTLAQKKVNIAFILDRLKKNPAIEPLIDGGTVVERTAHMIPEGGFNAIPPLVFDGMLIAGDSAGLVNGTHGLNLAMYSGNFAAQTALEALEKKDFSRSTLYRYRERLENSFVLKDMRANRRVPGWFSRNPTLVADYISLINHVSMQVSTVYPISRKEKRRLIRREVLDRQPPGKLLADLVQAIWSSK